MEEKIRTEILSPTPAEIDRACAEILAGGLVAFATETVYGLGANALDEAAVKKIFAAKGRPSDNPLIVHVANVSALHSIAYVTPLAQKAAEHFMPGALTLVLKKRDCIPDVVSGGLATVAVRIPAHPVAQKLLQQAGVPIAAPSANTSTRPSPTTAAHVLSDLDGKIRYILDGGSCKIGLESTIVDFSGQPRLLRHGGVAIEELEAVLGTILEQNYGGGAPQCPGQKYRHYAPNCLIKLVENGDFSAFESALSEASGGGALGLALSSTNLSNKSTIYFHSAEEYANRLFDIFRWAEVEGIGTIVCMLAPDKGIGKSLNNRLKKAAGA